MSDQPNGLIAVTNRASAALIPSDLYDPLIQRAHQDNHLYLIVIGPRLRVRDLKNSRNGQVAEMEFATPDEGWKPRSVRLPPTAFPLERLTFFNGFLSLAPTSHDAGGRVSPARLARTILEPRHRLDDLPGSWYERTIEKFFTYRVEYVGQGYGRDKRRSAVERLNSGHEHFQQVLAGINDFHPDSDVAVILIDADVQGRELSFSLRPDNVTSMSAPIAKLMARPDGPLIDPKVNIDAVEAMLIRLFQPPENTKLKGFPLRDAPSLVAELREEGITHLGVELDIAKSNALLVDPMTGVAAPRHRYSVNLETGRREAASNAPLAWTM